MVQRILVGLNGTPAAESVLPYVVALAKGFGADLTLVYAVGAGADVAAPPRGPVFQPAQDGQEAAGRAYLHGVQKRLRDTGVVAYSRVAVGDPAGELLTSAALLGSDLIALAAHGRVGFHHLARQCIAEIVLDNSSAAVLLVPAGDQVPPQPAIREIVAVLDGSANDAAVAPLAGELARTLTAPLVLFRPVEKKPSAVVAVTGVQEGERALIGALRHGTEAYLEEVAAELRRHEDLLDAPRRAAEAYLEQVAVGLRAAGLTVTTVTPVGRLGAVLEDYTAMHPESLVVMAAHDHPAPAGSAADATHRDVEYLSAPVLVVRPAADSGS